VTWEKKQEYRLEMEIYRRGKEENDKIEVEVVRGLEFNYGPLAMFCSFSLTWSCRIDIQEIAFKKSINK
jgi:hypothetical protein